MAVVYFVRVIRGRQYPVKSRIDPNYSYAMRVYRDPETKKVRTEYLPGVHRVPRRVSEGLWAEKVKECNRKVMESQMRLTAADKSNRNGLKVITST